MMLLCTQVLLMSTAVVQQTVTAAWQPVVTTGLVTVRQLIRSGVIQHYTNHQHPQHPKIPRARLATTSISYMASNKRATAVRVVPIPQQQQQQQQQPLVAVATTSYRLFSTTMNEDNNGGQDFLEGNVNDQEEDTTTTTNSIDTIINTTTNTTPNYFLVKSEPSTFSINDLQQCPNGRDDWDGVRNYQARNILRSMKIGDRAFFYHSSCKVPSVVGTVRIVQEAQPDETAFDQNHTGYDPKSTKDHCRWDMVGVQLERIYKVPVTLQELKSMSKVNPILTDMVLFRNSRLSVQEVTEPQWNIVEELAIQKEKEQ